MTLLFLITKIHGIEVTGKYGASFNTIGLIVTLSAAALGLALTRVVAKNYITKPAETGECIGLFYLCGIGIASLFTTLVIIFAGPLAMLVFGNHDMANILRCFAPYAIGAVWGTLQMGVLSGVQRFDQFALINIEQALARLLIVGTAVVYGNLQLVIIATVMAQFIGSALAACRIRRITHALGITPRLKNCWRHQGELWKFALPTVVSSGILAPANWACQILLVKHSGGAMQMGMVAIATQWQNVVRFLPQRTIEVALPKSTQLAHGSNLWHYRVHLKHLMWSVGGGGIVIAGLCILFSPGIAHIYASNTDGLARTLAAYFGVAAISVIVRIMTQDLLARGLAKDEMLLSGGRAICLLAIWYLIEEKTAFNLALITLGSYAALIILMSRRWLGILVTKSENN